MDRVGVEPTTSAHQQRLSKQGPCMHLLLSHPERLCRADVEMSLYFRSTIIQNVVQN